MDNLYNNDLIFGKNSLEGVVSIEPSNKDDCILFVQNNEGDIKKLKVKMSHWMLYTEKLSDKMVELKGNQPYKYLMEYDNAYKYQDILKQSRDKKLDLYTCKDNKEAFMMKEGYTYYKGLKVKDISILSFDLEHTYGIGEVPNKDGRLLMISNTYRDSKGNLTRKSFFYDEHKDEANMIEDWTRFVRECDPSIIVGHNIFGHDFKILRHAAKKNNTSLKLGRNNSALSFDYKKSLKRKDGSQAYDYFNVLCYGREIVDTFFLALNYDIGRNYESYGLKSIMKHEGLEKKDRVHYDASKIITNYLIKDEWNKIKSYGQDDSDDSLALFDLMIPNYFYLAQSLTRSLQYINNSATGSWINGFLIRSYLQQGHSIPKATELPEHTEGGISFAVPGLYKNVYKIDLKSAYPSQVLRFKLYDKEKDPEANFYKMIDYFYKERFALKELYKKTNDKYYKDRDATAKVFLNSAYGLTITNKLNFNSPVIGAKITKETRDMIDMSLLWASGKTREYWFNLSKE